MYLCNTKFFYALVNFSLFLILEKVFKAVYNIFCWVLENVDTENS